MKKRLALIFSAICLCAAFFTGCGKAVSTVEITETSLYISKDGKVTAYILEAFEQDYYSVSELRSMIEEEIDAYYLELGYSGQENSLVKLVDITELPEKQSILLKMEFATSKEYEGFNDSTFFYGTVQEAYAGGYQLNVTLKDVSNSQKTISEKEIKEMKDNHILLIEDNIKVYLPQKILYASQDAQVIKTKEAMPNHTEGYSCILTN